MVVIPSGVVSAPNTVPVTFRQRNEIFVYIHGENRRAFLGEVRDVVESGEHTARLDVCIHRNPRPR